MLEAVLGLEIDATRRQITFSHPTLPQALDEVRIRNLTVADASVDLTVHRYAGSVGVSVERRDGKVEIVVHS
jgi:hypothetical protein